MISFAGLGDAAGGGEVTVGGDSEGVGSVLGVVATVGVASGEFVAWFWVGVQLDKSNIKPATTIAKSSGSLIFKSSRNSRTGQAPDTVS